MTGSAAGADPSRCAPPRMAHAHGRLSACSADRVGWSGVRNAPPPHGLQANRNVRFAAAASTFWLRTKLVWLWGISWMAVGWDISRLPALAVLRGGHGPAGG